MRLGGVIDRLLAQIDGFKSRAMRVEAPALQRYLYASEWRSLDAAEVSASATLMIGNAGFAECARLSSHSSVHELAAKISDGVCISTGMMMEAQGAQRSLSALGATLVLVQAQAGAASAPSSDPSHACHASSIRAARPSCR